MAALQSFFSCVVSPAMHTEHDRTTDFRLSMQAVLGERLIVARSEREPWALTYDVVCGAAPVGSLRLDDSCAVANLASSEGEWCLQKRRRLGWELLIESAGGRHVGWYSGRRLLSGGTISLTDGTQIDLRRSITGEWTLEDRQTGRRIAEMRISGPPLRQRIGLTIRRLPARTTEGSVVILTSCAVRILYRMITAPIAATGGG
jgi:hypothetical protein